MEHFFSAKKYFFPVVIAIIIITPFSLLGQIRESTNYKIDRDSVNVGGGFSESNNYGVTDSVGQSISGGSESDNYELGVAGFQQQGVETFIAISAPADVTLDAISGLSGGVSTSSIDWNVETNNSSGYELSVQASTNPAMQSPSFVIADYAPVGANPDYAWDIDATEAAFGYSVSGENIDDFFKDNGSSCNTDSGNTTNTCWYGFSTSDQIIAGAASSNSPGGATTTVEIQAEIGASYFVTPGDYSATITVTAVTL